MTLYDGGPPRTDFDWSELREMVECWGWQKGNLWAAHNRAWRNRDYSRPALITPRGDLRGLDAPLYVPSA